MAKQILAIGNSGEQLVSKFNENFTDLYDSRSSTIITVAKSGGDYTTLTAAYAAITDSSVYKWYEVWVYPGIYEEKNLVVPNCTITRGINKKHCIVRYFDLPSANEEVLDHSIMRCFSSNIPNNVIVENLTIENKNNFFTLWPTTTCIAGYDKKTQIFRNLIIRNYGQEEIIAANPTYADTRCNCLGLGTTRGVDILFEDCDFYQYGRREALFVHMGHTATWIPTYSSNLKFRNIRVNKYDIHLGGVGGTFYFTDLGRTDHIFFDNFKCNVGIYIGKMDTTEGLLYANCMTDLFQFDNCKDLILSLVRGGDWLALQIVSDDITSSGSVNISGGTAFSILFDTVKTKLGGDGLSAKQIGITNTKDKLGILLGDCSSVNKTLIVAIDGGASQTITFNENFTAQNDAYVLAFINAVLTGAIASQYNYCLEYYPNEDAISIQCNTSVNAIIKGMTVTYNTYGVRAMAKTDLSLLNAGIALEDIAPGEYGRVKNGGLTIEYKYFSYDPATIPAQGDLYELSATNGKIVKNNVSTNAVWKCIVASTLTKI